jgi:hypothetical protein
MGQEPRQHMPYPSPASRGQQEGMRSAEVPHFPGTSYFNDNTAELVRDVYIGYPEKVAETLSASNISVTAFRKLLSLVKPLHIRIQKEGASAIARAELEEAFYRLRRYVKYQRARDRKFEVVDKFLDLFDQSEQPLYPGKSADNYAAFVELLTSIAVYLRRGESSRND